MPSVIDIVGEQSRFAADKDAAPVRKHADAVIEVGIIAVSRQLQQRGQDIERSGKLIHLRPAPQRTFKILRRPKDRC